MMMMMMDERASERSTRTTSFVPDPRGETESAEARCRAQGEALSSLNARLSQLRDAHKTTSAGLGTGGAHGHPYIQTRPLVLLFLFFEVCF